jgi:hypothetical protein
MAAALASRPALAALAADHPPPLVAVFPVEVVDTSGEPPNPQWPKRIANVTHALAGQLAESGRYRTVELAPGGAILQCAACWRDPARAAGAEEAAIAAVHKMSTLIASLHVWLVDVSTGRTVRKGAVSLRGDTEEAWRRAVGFLLRRGILDPDPEHQMLSSPFPGGG